MRQLLIENDGKHTVVLTCVLPLIIHFVSCVNNLGYSSHTRLVRIVIHIMSTDECR